MIGEKGCLVDAGIVGEILHRVFPPARKEQVQG
jgi:hypothetical protein